ncbi:hypothetical protein [Rheinheimera sp.]|uniref:hypothetical protein n=1 Tax=Rheinheimera sp. TaxID=1869214 RepID=UPI00273364F5|nr:hypothetical protein [Rheinheimera sp.]MDP2715552.1 hypothetical protein [Rheinheimera sp.]
MIDAQYLKSILDLAKASGYAGVTSGLLVKTFCPNSDSDEEFHKFKYHMDEIWAAGLLRVYHGSNRNTWGLVGASGSFSLTDKELVLTPSGDQVQVELSKSHGLENLTKAIKKVAGMAGEEALKHAVVEFCKM